MKTTNDVVGAWWDLLEWLFTRYNNGARIDDWHSVKIEPTALFYPFEWLKARPRARPSLLPCPCCRLFCSVAVRRICSRLLHSLG